MEMAVRQLEAHRRQPCRGLPTRARVRLASGGDGEPAEAANIGQHRHDRGVVYPVEFRSIVNSHGGDGQELSADEETHSGEDEQVKSAKFRAESAAAAVRECGD